MQEVIERACGPREHRTRSTTLFEQTMRSVAPDKRCYPFGIQYQKPTSIHNPCAEFKFVGDAETLQENQVLSHDILLVCVFE